MRAASPAGSARRTPRALRATRVAPPARRPPRGARGPGDVSARYERPTAAPARLPGGSWWDRPVPLAPRVAASSRAGPIAARPERTRPTVDRSKAKRSGSDRSVPRSRVFRAGAAPPAQTAAGAARRTRPRARAAHPARTGPAAPAAAVAPQHGLAQGAKPGSSRIHQLEIPSPARTGHGEDFDLGPAVRRSEFVDLCQHA